MRARWAAGAVILTLAVGACGGAADDPDDPGSGGTTPGAATPAGGGGGGSSGSVDGPITVEVEGETYAMDIGTCDVADADVRASAGRSDGSIHSLDVRISPDAGAVLRVNLPAADGTTLQLAGGEAVPGTTWDVRVDGTTAIVEASMENQGAGGPPVQATITIRCTERGFGGMAPEPTDAPMPTADGPAPTAAGEATITVDLAGTTYTFQYYGCPMAEPAFGFVVLDTSGNRLFVSAEEAQVLLADGTAWLARGVSFNDSGTTATWSGTMTSSSGDAPATVTIACG